MPDSFFKLKESGTNIKREIRAGLTTFITMAYIIIVNPAILQHAGFPYDASIVATILSAAFGTLLMGVYANRPFAIAPYMGENAFMAYVVCAPPEKGGLGYPWQTGLGIIFIGGILFTLLTICRLRVWLAKALPMSLKCSFAVGIGLFLTFIGLNVSGIVSLGVAGAPVKLGDLTEISVVLAILGFVIISILMIKKVPGAILTGILLITFLSLLLQKLSAMGIIPLKLQLIDIPKTWFSLPPSISPTLFKLDILSALTWGCVQVILVVFILDFFDTMATLIGVGMRAGFLDKDGNLPQIEKPMLSDALATVFASIVGTTTAGTYIESAAGVEEGGRTGLVAIVVALLFLLSLFFAPFVKIIPPFAYGPALIIVGLLMLSPITKINFGDYTELIPAFAVIILISFTYNIGIGMNAGFVLYPLFKLISGRYKEVHLGMWLLGLLSFLFFIFYPY